VQAVAQVVRSVLRVLLRQLVQRLNQLAQELRLALHLQGLERVELLVQVVFLLAILAPAAVTTVLRVLVHALQVLVAAVLGNRQLLCAYKTGYTTVTPPEI
jgi:hypothetical protein